MNRISELSFSSDNVSIEENDNIVYEFNDMDFIVIQCDVESTFDLILRKRWEKAMKSGVMNYPINDALIKKIISPDKFKFVIVLLEGRGPGKRRSPEAFNSLKMPFNPDKFNFTKIEPNELLFKIKSINPDLQLELNASIIVNKCPIEYGSSLLVPYIDQCLPQVMTQSALHMAVSIVALTDFQGLRLGFNSPGSMASVNHLHWHIYYFNHRLPIEDLAILDYVLQEWPIPAIVFEITELSDDFISVILKDAMRIIEFCLEDGNISYNIFISRTMTGVIRVFIWLLEPRFGQKDNSNINIGFCELSGYFICKTKESFDSISEEKLLDCYQKINTQHDKVLHLLQ